MKGPTVSEPDAWPCLVLQANSEQEMGNPPGSHLSAQARGWRSPGSHWTSQEREHLLNSLPDAPGVPVVIIHDGVVDLPASDVCVLPDVCYFAVHDEAGACSSHSVSVSCSREVLSCSAGSAPHAQTPLACEPRVSLDEENGSGVSDNLLSSDAAGGGTWQAGTPHRDRRGRHSQL